MVNKASGVMDIIAAFVIFFNMYGVMPWYLVLSVVIYLIIKMIVHFDEPLHMIDGLVALIALVNLLYHSIWIGYIIVIYLAVKGVYFLTRK